MIYRKLDENGDYSFGGNLNNFVIDAESVTQAILTRLRLLKYEWWENLEDGLPLWQDILAQRDTANARSIILKRIEQTRNVQSVAVTSVTFNPNTRSFAFSAVVNTVFGAIRLQEVDIK